MMHEHSNDFLIIPSDNETTYSDMLHYAKTNGMILTKMPVCTDLEEGYVKRWVLVRDGD